MSTKTARADVEPVRQRTQWAKQPLGQISDRQLAAKLGIRRLTVLAARQRLGIAPFNPAKTRKGIDWDGQPLGQKSDTALAKELGVACSVVFNARKRRGIPPLTPRTASVDWAAMPLGQYPDEIVARIAKVSQPTVTRHRNRLGILPHQHDFATLEGEGANYPEALIDLFWHEQDIPHEFQVKIGPYVADWVIHEDTVVEYAGLVNHSQLGATYSERLKKKVAFYQSQGWKVQVIRPEDRSAYEPSTLLVRRAK